MPKHGKPALRDTGNGYVVYPESEKRDGPTVEKHLETQEKRGKVPHHTYVSD